jgi:hypothetical protein
MDLKRFVDRIISEGVSSDVDFEIDEHRGVIHLRDGDFLLYSNNGYWIKNPNDGRADIHRMLAGQADELGFVDVKDAKDHGWAMLVRFREGCSTYSGRRLCRELLTRIVNLGDADGKPYYPTFYEEQIKEAERTLDKVGPLILPTYPAAAA